MSVLSMRCGGEARLRYVGPTPGAESITDAIILLTTVILPAKYFAMFIDVVV
jgi:hypothetical protein